MMGQTKAKVPLASVGRSGWDTLSESRKNLRRKRYTREHMRIIWASRHCIRGPEGATLLADHIDHPRVFQKPNLRHKYGPPRRTVTSSPQLARFVPSIWLTSKVLYDDSPTLAVSSSR